MQNPTACPWPSLTDIGLVPPPVIESAETPGFASAGSILYKVFEWQAYISVVVCHTF